MIEDDIDVTTILDKSGVLEKEEVREQEVEFDKWELSDIIEELLDYKSNMYRDKYHTEEEIEYQTSGENMHEILDLYRQGDNYGLISQGKFYTAITLGNKRGTIELLSSVSGGGKSRRIIGKLTSLIAPELWDYNKEEFVPNINNPNNELSAVYIGSELDLSNEVKPIALATICGLETSQIKDYNNLTEEEEERIEKGIEIMDKMKLHLYSLLNYDIATIVRLVKKHQRNENVYALGFDYIEKTSNIVNEYKETYSSQFVPSHELYLYISKSLKERVAKKLDIYVVTATQLNAKSESNEHQVSSAMIRGSYALIDKFDIGCITLFIKPEELKVYESFLTTRRGFDRESLRPNMVSYVFKNRNGVYVLIKIFQCVNLGNMRTRDLLITNYHNEIINIEGVEKEDLTYEDLEKMNAEINKKATVGGINGVIGDFAEDVM